MTANYFSSSSRHVVYLFYPIYYNPCETVWENIAGCEKDKLQAQFQMTNFNIFIHPNIDLLA